MQLFGIARLRIDLVADALYGGGIQLGEVLVLQGESSTYLHGAGTTFLEWRVVEEGERLPVQDLMSED